MAARRVLTLGDYDAPTRSVRVLASTRNSVEGEALETWDLERFEKNPVILWGHDSGALPIGRAEDIAQGPDGLSMRIVFASEAANPFASHVAHLVREKIVRGVSVGFEPGVAREEDRDGEKVQVRTANNLLEVSFVAIPKDEDAGTSALHTDRTEHLDASLSKVEWTAWGAARIPARICRVGVLDYPGRRELRPEDEVLKADSVASLKGVPVIDIVDHTEYVLPGDFRQKVLGFVEEAHVDGEFVAGTLLIHDGPTIEAIKRGERLDLSAGYYAPTDDKPGQWRGERYDRVQRDIIYNHVALCPPGRGRAGSEVGLKLDAHDPRGDGRSGKGTTMKVIVINGKEYEVGTQAHLDAIDAINQAKCFDLQKQIDSQAGRLDAAEKAVTKAQEDLEEERKKSRESDKENERTLASRVKSRVRLVMKALRLFGEDEDDDKDEDKKMDALCELSERDLHLKAILKADPDFKADGKSDDYVAGKFEGAVAFLSNDKGVDGVVRAIEESKRRLDANDGTRGEHPVAKSRRENRERMAKLADQPATGGGAR